MQSFSVKHKLQRDRVPLYRLACVIDHLIEKPVSLSFRSQICFYFVYTCNNGIIIWSNWMWYCGLPVAQACLSLTAIHLWLTLKGFLHQMNMKKLKFDGRNQLQMPLMKKISVKLKWTLVYCANRKSMNVLIFLWHVNCGMTDSDCYYFDHPWRPRNC